ncbi:HEPN domain-containing protein [Brenneria goodwinii]|uniref:HEPN domain-containing protein n=1 Tax=Brenneria goodwinii TaxID=1109412 RepID=UPI0036EE8154
MATTFDVISEDFLKDLTAISDLVEAVRSVGASARARIASINSSTLLLAATFEEYVREMGRQYARELVLRVNDPQKLPRKLTATAWKRTLEQLARAKIDTGGTPLSLVHISSEARASFDSVWEFLGGDLTQDIYSSLIHNENNMRPGEINAVFSVCELKDICLKISSKQELKDHFNEDDERKVHGLFMTAINDFMEKRNDIAHALNVENSIGVDDFHKTLDLMKAFSSALSSYLPLYLLELPAEAA